MNIKEMEYIIEHLENEVMELENIIMEARTVLYDCGFSEDDVDDILPIDGFEAKGEWT